MKKKNVLVAIATLGMFAITACGTPKTEEAEEVTTEEVVEEVVVVETPNIIGVASVNENFSTLVAAVAAAGLVETLSGDGPFTVFAPTNDAFAALPEGAVDNLLKPENLATLSGILTYHVVSGKFEAAAVVEAINTNGGSFEIATVQGGILVASLDGDNVIITDENGNAATVVIADVAASNGVIHAINSVVMPK
ncbi:MAG: putative surface protein with fasciclin (FAS1) repeats [Bacteroidia bacterium]|jgi:uncharacterized surface protein with fasciclin (FAS1) repeats|tara:strand:- start:400 stop:981 length:582 start_codon:yes stop_codon:yes gene_type:complete